ncbi:hypothetical protein [Peredibacter starrii]|uniref:Uncharacterized protein n=1 Tax=Peredibacter starrii TaxID=28202 RepID=A0AAX4HN50_9BACT|nr:hypothetical protein [Peredibacter starrii]WPU64686.1 hypothetical protein SOO65_18490 [Peredibacter starrii]
MILVTSMGHAATNSYINGHLGAMSNQAHGNVGNVPGNRYNADFEFDYYKNNNTTYTRGLETRFTAAAQVNDQSLTQYSLQEAYVGGNLTSKDSLKVGRQIVPWSTVDAVWGFGKVNNRRNFDYFLPGQEGLIGLAYERKSSNGMRYRTFLSGLYVPETNPPLDIDKKDKTITSRSPWADPPASSTVYQGVPMKINYDVDYPQINEVIYRYTIGANLGYESKHWVADTFIMRKPENQLTADVDVNVDIVGKVINANVAPKFYYHDVYGSTLKYRNLDFEMYVSGIAVRPQTNPDVQEDVKYTEIKNQKRREDYVGGGISRSNDLYTIAMNYVARLSPFDRDKDDLALDPRWNQAVNIFASRNFGRFLTLSADGKFDMLTTDRLVMLRASYKVTQELLMNFGVNMIGTPGDGKSYWSPYKNNDAVFGALRYVF